MSIDQKHNIDQKIERNGNSISYRSLSSYHMDSHHHDAVQVLIPLEHAHFEIAWALEDKEMESKSLGAADICLIPPRLEHEVRWFNRAHFVNFYITPEFICEQIDPGFDSQDQIIKSEIGIEDRFLYYLSQTFRDYCLKYSIDHNSLDNSDDVSLSDRGMNGKGINEKYIDSVLTVVAQHLIDHYIQPDQKPVLFNDYAQLPCEKIREAILYMASNLDRNLSVEEIADSVSMSYYHFTRVFKETIGIPPAKFHLQQRIDKSKELLKQQQPIIEVANDLGFSSQAHFSNVFSKSVGITPKQFAIQARG